MDRATLKALGFQEKTYADQKQIGDGIFMTKTVPVTSMPYFNEHVVNVDDFVSETMNAVVEITPDNMIQMVVLESDYTEEAVPLDSDEGMGLLRDACGGSINTKEEVAQVLITSPLDTREWDRVFDALCYHYEGCDSDENEINTDIEERLRLTVEAGGAEFHNVLTKGEWDRVFEAIDYHYAGCDPYEHEINRDILDRIEPTVTVAIQLH